MKPKEPIHILVAAGGTGGHLFPALAVAEELERMAPGEIKISFVGNPDRIESEIIPAKGYDFYTINLRGLNKLLSLKTLMLPVKIFAATMKCRKIIRNYSVDAVLCTGAYLSYPPGAAAHQERKPLILMESNVYPGKAIRLLSLRADMIFTAFDESRQYFGGTTSEKVRPYGNPVRGMISRMPEQNWARREFGLDPERPVVLVFGGSLGAKAINEAVAGSLDSIARSDFQVIWQRGKLFPQPAKLPDNVVSREFIEDMASAYAAADLVVSRSGATTVAELCSAAKPSVLVPLPTASNNEQESNARVLENNGAAIMVDNSAITSRFMPLATELLADRERLGHMARQAGSLARPDAARRCAEDILRLVRARKQIS